MSHDKAIEHGKEHREPYRRSKAVSRQCRNHGACSRCEGDRKVQLKREICRCKTAISEAGTDGEN
jgi:hypothetical protein